jgi:hypothetical protein
VKAFSQKTEQGYTFTSFAKMHIRKHIYDLLGYRSKREPLNTASLLDTLLSPNNRELVTVLRNMGLTPETTVYDTEENELNVHRVESDSTTIEMPLEGMTAAKIENLRRMVEAKTNLLKTAMGAEELPIQVMEDRICFPWFNWILDGTEFEAYATFISQLCKTAIAKTRVTATARVIEGSEKYAMRCFMLSLGMIGPEFQNSRRTILAKFEGDSSWKNGKPEKTAAAEIGMEFVDGKLVRKEAVKA